ncbi:MAG: DCC1-like thiol-disulfide oxidoreductase family protein [Pseudomonadota bacterium]
MPRFDETKTILVMDGGCALCTSAGRLIARLDSQDQFRIAPVASTLGSALLRHFGFDPIDPDSWLVVSDGQGQTGLHAVITAYTRLHWVFYPLLALMILPKPARDWLYARVARSRYRLFGRADMCAVTDPRLQRRLITD